MLARAFLSAADFGVSYGTFTFLSTTPVYVSTGTSASIPYPTGVQAGDLLIIVGMIQNATAIGTSSGWTSVIGAGSYGTAICKTAVGGETGSVAVSWGVSTPTTHTMVVVRHSSGKTPLFELNNAAYGTNPSLPLTTPSGSYTQAIHLVNYTDNSAINMSALNANLTLLQYRTTSYGSWLGWINTSVLGMIGSTITSNSNANAMSLRLFNIYIN